MAVQPRVGILPQRRSGPGGRGFACTSSGRAIVTVPPANGGKPSHRSWLLLIASERREITAVELI
jgi:hypothetical protein